MITSVSGQRAVVIDPSLVRRQSRLVTNFFVSGSVSGGVTASITMLLIKNCKKSVKNLCVWDQCFNACECEIVTKCVCLKQNA